MLIKLTDKNKKPILLETNNVVSCSKHGEGLNGINTVILLGNVDRSDAKMFVFETTEEIYHIEREALKDYRMVNNYVVKIDKEPKIQVTTPSVQDQAVIEEKKTLI